jgi:hypothetical protein
MLSQVAFSGNLLDVRGLVWKLSMSLRPPTLRVQRLFSLSDAFYFKAPIFCDCLLIGVRVCLSKSWLPPSVPECA